MRTDWTLTDMAERGASETFATWPTARRVEVARNVLHAAGVPALVAEVERLRAALHSADMTMVLAIGRIRRGTAGAVVTVLAAASDRAEAVLDNRRERSHLGIPACKKGMPHTYCEAVECCPCDEEES